MSIKLLTRADDAGSFETANRAIAETVENGIVRNVSVMAPAPAFGHAVDELAGLTEACFGVHATLTSEWDDSRWGPILSADDVPSLVRADGTFPATGQELAELDPDPEEIRIEVTAQIDAIRDAGFDPVYLDVHMAIDWVRNLDKIFDDVREGEGLLSGDDAPILPDVDTDETGPDRLLAQLNAIGSGTYLAVGHPCFPDAEIEGITVDGNDAGLPKSRDAERRMFMDERVVGYCEEHGIEPVSFADI